MIRARLFLSQLESRENPSVTYLDPITGLTVTVEDPPAPPTTDPGIVSIINAATATAGGATGGTTTTTTTTTDPLLGTNGVYNVPLFP